MSKKRLEMININNNNYYYKMVIKCKKILLKVSF